MVSGAGASGEDMGNATRGEDALSLEFSALSETQASAVATRSDGTIVGLLCTCLQIRTLE